MGEQFCEFDHPTPPTFSRHLEVEFTGDTAESDHESIGSGKEFVHRISSDINFGLCVHGLIFCRPSLVLNLIEPVFGSLLKSQTSPVWSSASGGSFREDLY